ncbi:LysR family transcriptional regulator [Erysipelothrix tonsillarum]|uniref:LysR family transcriptional regulator n=1 Tax=Erysipelothrix tonsillarum TaxID=38402 RepID=UPI00035FE106|nr:LysR family transcriptional regulator [Erysipelothrix tonsillarum]
MDLRHFQTFVKVVEKESFSKAADALGYTQAAVTVQIKQLEEELHTKLFDRMHRKIHLTEEGEAFIFYANEVLRTVEEARIFNQSIKKEHGTIRVGTVGSLGATVFPELIYNFHQEHPNVEIKVIIGKTEELLAMVRRNEIDILFTLDYQVYGSDMIKVFEKEEPILFVSADSSVRVDKIYKLKEFSDSPFLLTEQGEAYRYELERGLAKRRVNLNAILEVGDTEIIIAVLKKGLGLSFLPEFSVREALDLQELKVVQVDIPPISMYSQVLYHEKKFLTTHMKAFIQEIDKTYIQKQ